MNLALLASVEVNLLLSQVSYINVPDCAKRCDQILLEIQSLAVALLPPGKLIETRSYHPNVSSAHFNQSLPYPYSTSTQNPAFTSHPPTWIHWPRVTLYDPYFTLSPRPRRVHTPKVAIYRKLIYPCREV